MPLLTNDIRMNMLLKQFGGVNYTPTTSYSVAAVTRVPDDEIGSGIEEPVDTAYERLEIPNDDSHFGPSDAGTEVVNLTDWAFPQPTADWGVVYGLALYDDSDNYLGFAPYGTPRFVQDNRILRIPIGAFKISPEDTPLSIIVEETPLPQILTSPNGSRYALSVSNAGAVVFTAFDSFGPPAPPTSLDVTSGVLSWTASAYDGGSPIISYTVWLSDSDSKLISFEVLDPDAVSYDTDGALGVFFVTADNVYGPSAPSNEVTIS